MSNIRTLTLDQTGVDEGAVLAAVRSAFLELGAGTAVQPPQVVTGLPGGGDSIVYQAVLPQAGVYALKVSPYLPQSDGPAIVTAWTLLMSTTTGEPLLLADSKALTAERTAATSALAVDLLAPADAKTLAVVGLGPIGRAHVRYARRVRDFDHVRVYSRGDVGSLDALGAGVTVAASAEEAAAGADVVMLCTSAAEPVVQAHALPPGTVVTSVSTNAPRAHEIDPAGLAQLDVYCDYRPAAMASAGDFLIASEQHGFTVDDIRGDLAGLLSGRDPSPSGERPVFFRSVGLGIEDAAVAAVAMEGGQR